MIIREREKEAKMTTVENKYDFSIKDLSEILLDMPDRVQEGSTEQQATYIIRQLNINAILREYPNLKRINRLLKAEEPPKKESKGSHGAPYRICITKNDGEKPLFDMNVRTIAFYAYDPLQGDPIKAILSEQKPKPTDIANICELLGDIRHWGMYQ